MILIFLSFVPEFELKSRSRKPLNTSSTSVLFPYQIHGDSINSYTISFLLVTTLESIEKQRRMVSMILASSVCSRKWLLWNRGSTL